MLQQGLEKGIADPSRLKDLFKGKKEQGGAPPAAKEKTRDMLKGLFGK